MRRWMIVVSLAVVSTAAIALVPDLPKTSDGSLLKGCGCTEPMPISAGASKSLSNCVCPAPTPRRVRHCVVASGPDLLALSCDDGSP
jgi:hypothetical protein